MLHGGEEYHIRLETHTWIMLQLVDSVQHVLLRHMWTGQDRAGQGRAGVSKPHLSKVGKTGRAGNLAVN